MGKEWFNDWKIKINERLLNYGVDYIFLLFIFVNVSFFIFHYALYRLYFI